MPRRSRGPQLGFQFRTWGGSRPRAGRPPNGPASGVSHLTRPALSRHHPVHVTLRVTRGIESLRGSAMFRAVRGALACARDRFGFRLVHYSVQRDHLHLLAEAGDRRALSRGMQGLSIRVAKAINGVLGRSGRVFADRYHARALKTPREARWALRYVLSNARKHGGNIPSGFVDARSSAPWFKGWTRPAVLAFVARKDLGAGEAPVVAPTSWLLRVGYRRAGPIDVDDAPARAAAD